MTDNSRRRWVLALTSVGFFMAMMDSMIVTTATTAIRKDFGVDVGQLQWTLNAYTVTIAAVLLMGVAIGNRIGHRRLYVIGLFVFVVGSLACALSGDLEFLIAARVLQGIGASVITPMSMAILVAAHSPSERGKALGIWSGVGGLALIIGPALGGLIVAQFSWQWIFWINVPIGLVSMYLSRAKLAESESESESEAGGPWPNLVDSILVVVSFGGIVWALSESVSRPGDASALAVGGLSAVLLAGFVRRQARSAAPMVPLTLFRSSTFSGGVVATFLLYAAMYGVIFFLPQYLQVAKGANALVADLELLPWTGTLVVLSPFAGRAVDRFGERPVAATALLLQAAGYLWIALTLSPGSSYGPLIAPLVVSGAGISIAGPALQKAVMGAVSRAHTGTASGVFNMFRQLGGAVGTAVAVILFYAAGDVASAAAFSDGFSAVASGCVVIAVAGLACSLGLHSARSAPAPQPERAAPARRADA